MSYVASAPDDANDWSWLGYANRKRGSLDAAFTLYKLDPKHREAHEYLGEAYSMAGLLNEVEEKLRTPEKPCRQPCEELKSIKRAVARYSEKTAGG